jgi:hypothetical protein
MIPHTRTVDPARTQPSADLGKRRLILESTRASLSAMIDADAGAEEGADGDTSALLLLIGRARMRQDFSPGKYVLACRPLP